MWIWPDTRNFWQIDTWQASRLTADQGLILCHYVGYLLSVSVASYPSHKHSGAYIKNRHKPVGFVAVTCMVELAGIEPASVSLHWADLHV